MSSGISIGLLTIWKSKKTSSLDFFSIGWKYVTLSLCNNIRGWEVNINLTLSYVSWSVSPRNGYSPNIIQYKVTPTAHVSDNLPW